jgi:hypothetical protein
MHGSFPPGRHIVRYYPGDVHQPVLGLQKSRLAGTGVLLMTNELVSSSSVQLNGRLTDRGKFLAAG